MIIYSLSMLLILGKIENEQGTRDKKQNKRLLTKYPLYNRTLIQADA